MEPLLQGFLELVKTVGAPAAVALGWIYLYEKNRAKRQAPLDFTELKAYLDGAFKEAHHFADLDRTKHFDQLRRDLTTTIEKTIENRLSAYFAQAELDRRVTQIERRGKR